MVENTIEENPGKSFWRDAIGNGLITGSMLLLCVLINEFTEHELVNVIGVVQFVALAGSIYIFTRQRSLKYGDGGFSFSQSMAYIVVMMVFRGMNRSFTAEEWVNLIPKKAWYDAMDEANDVIDRKVQVDIQGYDLNPEAVKAARQNAKDAGVDHLIHFQERAVKDLSHPKKYGFIITNPPYGERLEDKKDLPQLYREFGESFKKLDSWSAYMITSYEDAERYFGRKADKNRKIYNGMLKTYFYQFLGPKPPRKTEKKESL